jgi:HAD superfamily hydrolase (TIGR01509 family)
MDMDGTLVDTEPMWMAAETRLVAEFGNAWGPADAARMIGLPLPEAAAVLQGHGVDLPGEAIVTRLLGHVVDAVRGDAPWQPGALALLGELAAVGVPSALVTMSYRELADAVTSQAPDGAFVVVVPGDEVTHGKPDPEPYLVAAARLGVDVTSCVAIEDSPPGIASALASGARTVGVQHIVPVEPRPGLSRVASLEQIGLAELARIAAGETLDLLGAARR